MYYCYRCDHKFSAEKRNTHASVKCPECKSSRDVVSVEHPFTKVNKCV